MNSPKTSGNLCSPDEDGCFDYIDGTISLYKYSKQDRKLLKNAISFRTGRKGLNSNLSNAIGLIVHEVTHYLDQTTTLWGLEFLSRRNNALRKIFSGETESREVFLLNASEILMHKDLVLVHSNVELVDINMSHTICYSEKYGPYISIEIKKDKKLVAQVPLSMLSLLEANAISNELMAHMKLTACALGHLPEYQESRICSKLDGILKDPDRLEYNILHILVKVHFENLNLYSRLALISAAVDFALNISSLDLAALANTLNESMSNKIYGDPLCNDLCRGMSRQVVAFKLILFIYEYTAYAGVKTQELEHYIANDFIRLVKMTLGHFERTLPSHGNEFDFSDLEFSNGIKYLRRTKGKIEPKNHISRMLTNRKIRKSNLSVSYCLGKYYLPDIILDDESRIKFRSRQRYKIDDLRDVNRREVDELNKLVSNISGIYKFHMDPSTIGPMQFNRFHNKNLSADV